MNARPDLERLVTNWLRSAAPLRAPRGVLSATLEQVAGVRQERPLGGRRFDEWIGRSPRLHWAIVGALLAAALLGTIVGVGALLRDLPVPRSGASNGWVAFAVQGGVRGSPSEIYIVRTGVPERRLVGSEGYGAGVRAACPSFSPDGTRLAYSEAQVTPTPPAIGSNAPFPGSFGASNRFIVVVRLDPTGSPTGTAVRIPVNNDHGDVCPTWSPDGASIAYLTASPPPSSVLWVADLNGNTRKVGASPANQFSRLAWAPDGTAIAAADDTGIWIVPISGGEPRLLVRSAPGLSSGGMAWSPDGTRIVVTGSFVRVFRVDDVRQPVELPGGSSLSWSPDGSRIAYVRTTVSLTGPTQSEIVTTSPAGDEVRAIATDRRVMRGLIWSPDGLRLLYAADDGPSGGLVSVSAVGDPAPIALTDQPHYLEFTSSENISWQPVFP